MIIVGALVIYKWAGIERGLNVAPINEEGCKISNFLGNPSLCIKILDVQFSKMIDFGEHEVITNEENRMSVRLKTSEINGTPTTSWVIIGLNSDEVFHAIKIDYEFLSINGSGTLSVEFNGENVRNFYESRNDRELYNIIPLPLTYATLGDSKISFRLDHKAGDPISEVLVTDVRFITSK